jgi:hypothetical protein
VPISYNFTPIPSSSAAVKNAWNYISTSPYLLMVWCLIKDRGNFTFTLPIPVNQSFLQEIQDLSKMDQVSYICCVKSCGVGDLLPVLYINPVLSNVFIYWGASD